MIPLATAEQFAAAMLERQSRPGRAADEPLDVRLWRAQRDYIRALGNSPLRLKYPSLTLFLRAVETAILCGGGNQFTTRY